MPHYRYIALDRSGTEVSGNMSASDSRQAGAALRERGLFPTELCEVGQPGAKSPPRVETIPRAKQGGVALPFFRSVKTRELAAFTRQLGTLLRAGMPLLRSLEVLSRQERNAVLRKIIDTLAGDIRAGATLSAALAAHGKIFDRLYVSMIRAGEAGGALDAVLDRLARFQEKSLQLRGKVTAAMVYPVIVLAVAVAILAGLLVLVVPKFKQIFADLLKGAPLPALTQGVLTISDFVRHNVAAVGGAIVVAVIAFRLLRRREAGARLVDTCMIRLPLFGDLMLEVVVARFVRTLGTLLASGVPILPALVIARDTCGNARVAATITMVHDRVKEGASIAVSLANAAVFPPLVPSMIEVGEQSGQLPQMLNKVADIYEEEVDNAVAGLSALIEPVLILFLAAVVGTVVIALFLPIVRIVQLLS